MKTIAKHTTVAVLAACLMFFTSCDSGFEELNVNPTQADQIDPNFKLTNIQVRISGERYENWRTNLIYSSVMIQHFATLPGYWSGDKYSYNSSYSAAMWDRYYPNITRNIEDLLVQTADDPDGANMNAITRILRVFMYHRLTDLYGDVPYSEAGKGFTHKRGDIVSIGARELGTLVNRVNHCDKITPWTFGVTDLMRNLSRRGLI